MSCAHTACLVGDAIEQETGDDVGVDVGAMRDELLKLATDDSNRVSIVEIAMEQPAEELVQLLHPRGDAV